MKEEVKTKKCKCGADVEFVQNSNHLLWIKRCPDCGRETKGYCWKDDAERAWEKEYK